MTNYAEFVAANRFRRCAQRLIRHRRIPSHHPLGLPAAQGHHDRRREPLFKAIVAPWWRRPWEEVEAGGQRAVMPEDHHDSIAGCR
jgi:hypothetical protein